MVSTALAAVIAGFPMTLAHAEKGGNGGGANAGAGGQSAATGSGNNGTAGSGTSGGGGGGAGEVGGNGGAGAGASPAAGGDGGAHGGVGAGLPIASATGTNGGDGENGGASSGGGGGGAGGYGYVVTGSGSLGTLSANVTGGNGGVGGSGQPAGLGGDGGKGIVFTDPSAKTVTIAAGSIVSGGDGGADGDGAGGGGAGGTGIEGANLDVTLAGTVAGGSNGAGTETANAFHFTGGTNSLSLDRTGVITGGIRTDGALDISTEETYTLSNEISGSGSISKSGTGILRLSGNNTYTGNTSISGGTIVAQSDSSLGAASGSVDVLSDGRLLLRGGVTIDKQALNSIGDNTALALIQSDTGDNSFTGVVNLGGSADILSFNGSLTLSGGVTGNGADQQLTIRGDGDTTVNGLSNISTLEKEDDGTLTLTGTSTLSDDFIVTGGDVIIDNTTLTTASRMSINGGEVIIKNGTLSSPSGFDRIGVSEFPGDISRGGGVTVTGSGASYYTNSVRLSSGRLTVIEGGTVTANAITAGGFDVVESGRIIVSGAGSSITTSSLNIGGAEAGGTLDITDGGVVETTNLTIGGFDATGEATVSGANSVLSVANRFTIGGLLSAGDSSLTVSDGATISAGDGAGTIRVGNEDSGSARGILNIGSGAGDPTGAGTIEAAALVMSGDFSLITFNHTEDDYVLAADISGFGAVFQHDGTTILTGENTYTRGTLITGGTLQIGDGGTSGSITGLVTNDGSLIFNRSDALTFDGQITGSGRVSQTGTGTLRLTADHSYSGGTTVENGTLIVDGSIEGDADVRTGASLSGAGSVGGLVTIADGGVLQGNTGQTLSIGSLTLSEGSNVDVALGPPSDSALFDVSGDLTLDGTVNVSDAGQFGPGVYRLMDYSGSLTDNGLEVGSVPSGTNSVIVQTALANRVNLVVDTAAPGPDPDVLTVQFWDGTQTEANGAIDTGSGTWSLGQTNWTRPDGNTNDEWQGGFAVIQGRDITITVDNSNGDISTSGMQFASDGILVQGGAVRLAGSNGQNIFRVGDGSGDPDMTATISSSLTGPASLIKREAGTLVLSGQNTYTGTTRIEGGSVSVSSDANLGGSTADVRLYGGTLATTESFESARPVLISTSGSVEVAADTELHLSGKVTGSGQFRKLGGGTLRLTGANSSFSHEIVEGTLIGDKDSIQGDIANSGILVFDQSASGRYGYSVSGSGAFIKRGDGVLSLVGKNTHTGGTIIEAGTLLVSEDSHLGDVSSALIFAGGGLFTTAPFDTDREVILTADGIVDVANGTELGFTKSVEGEGGLIKIGDGRLRLSGFNTYTGLTEIRAGTLIIDSSRLVGPVANEGVLVFDQDVDNEYGGDLSGTGLLIKEGSARLRMSGTSSHTGGTQILAGTLIGDTGSLFGDILNASTLIFDQDGNDVFNGTLSGKGSLEKTGGGAVTLNGLHPFTGDTLISEGTLIINGGTATEPGLGGDITIGESGALGGSGSLGSLNVSGTIAPGNSIGTLTVAGDASFGAGSVYEVEVDPAGSASDLIAVSGTANIYSGASVQHIGLDGIYAPTSTYTILTADGGVTGTFDSVATDFAFLDAALEYDANSVALTLTRNGVALTDVAQTANQLSVATSLAGLATSDALFGAVIVQDASVARASYDLLSGEIYASRKAAYITQSRLTRDAVNLRLRQPVEQVSGSQSDTVWTTVFGGWGNIEGTDIIASVDTDAAGVLLGADRAFSSGWRAGVMGGFSQSGHDVDLRSSSGENKTTHLGLYGSKSWGALSLRSGATYSWHDGETTRNIASANLTDRTKGSTDARTAQTFAEIGYSFATGGAEIEPFASIAYVNVETDGFTEAGGPSALTVEGDTVDTTLSTLGARLSSSTFKLSNMTGRFHASVGWQHAFDALDTVSTNRFANSAAFKVEGATAARDAGVVEAGLDLEISSRTKLGLGYQGQFGDRTEQQSVNASVAFTF
ncbi:autotransporter domain-containing protein [Henriciella barbarensis]|nr:autotransporter domain-containing protein [Henriciella barbarensis]